MALLFSYGGADPREIQHLTGEDSEAYIKGISKISKIVFNLYKMIGNWVQIHKGRGLNQYRPQFTKAQTNNPL